VLLTRAPLYQGRSPFSCDLHVLGAPLTFVLSQDQTLQLNLVSPRDACSWFREAGGARALAFGMRDRFGTGPAGLAGSDLASPRTHSSTPRALRMQRVGRALRAYDSVFKDRGSQGSVVGGGIVITECYCVKCGLSFSLKVTRGGPVLGKSSRVASRHKLFTRYPEQRPWNAYACALLVHAVFVDSSPASGGGI
jgi:hypothetical protein